MKGGNMSRKLLATAMTLAAVATLAFAAVASATSSATTPQAAPQGPATTGAATQVGAVTVQLQVKRFVKQRAAQPLTDRELATVGGGHG